MSIVPTDVPMTYGLCQETIGKIVEAYPVCGRRSIGTTAFGRELEALSIGSGGRTVLFSAAHHANEWITAPVLLKFAEELSRAIMEGGSVYGIPGRLFELNCQIFLVPMVDPDGVDLVTGAIPEGSLEWEKARSLADNYPNIPFPNGWKANLLGVDLNLQYPAGWLQAREIKFSQGYTKPGPRDYVGKAPLAQRESRAMAEFTRYLDPALTLAYHTQGETIYWKYDDIEVPGARALGEEFARLSGYSLEDTPYASGFAGYKDWFIKTWRRPGFTIEAGLGENPLPISQFDSIYEKNLGILTTAALGLPA